MKTSWNSVVTVLNGLKTHEKEKIIAVLNRDLVIEEAEVNRIHKMKQILVDFKKRGVGKILHYSIHIKTYAYFFFAEIARGKSKWSNQMFLL